MGLFGKIIERNRVGFYRAKPRGGVELDQDPSTMVQEQIARMKYFLERADVAGRNVLDLGCGTGFNCEYVCSHYGARRALGIDLSKEAVAFAKQSYPKCEFELGDICDPATDYGHGEWDVIVACEVIEHVQRPGALLDGIARHLSPDGIAFVSTPNRLVFSLGHEPSPVNQTHLKEYVLDEFRKILESRFSSVEISGQRFRSHQMEARRRAALERSIRDFRRLGNLYWNPIVRKGWKVFCFEPLWRWMEGTAPYKYSDFDFVIPPCENSIWFCAIVRK